MSEKKLELLPGGVTQADIAKWKKEHGTVKSYTVSKSEKETATCYLKKPDRKILGAALQAQKFDPLRAKEILLVNCWLGGDEEIKTDDVLFASVALELDDLIELKRVDIKEH